MMTVYLMCICIMGFFLCLALAFKPQETVGVTERLQRVQGGTGAAKRGLRDEDVMKKNFVSRVILPMADKVSKPFAGITPKGMLDECRRDIMQAGMIGKVTPVQITTLSWVLMIVAPTLVFFLTAGAPRDNQNWMMIGFAALLGYRMPIGIIKGKAAKRKAEILRALPFSLDLISISVEAGVAFDGAMQIVAEKTKGPLTDELNQTLNEIRLGKGRNDALYDLGERVGVDDLKSFLTAVIYISRLGGSLVDVIRIQATAMRIKRRQRAEEKAMKTPVKIMIPLVLFIFPAMFVVILGPAGIQLMDNFAGIG
jgi:tight adherence protein C